jgi:hypothetical protein
MWLSRGYQTFRPRLQNLTQTPRLFWNQAGLMEHFQPCVFPA